ncbi:MAG: arylsulfatase [Bacteroidales bacterium]|nr:arylsulfatase [Bacteroidales bacterium]
MILRMRKFLFIPLIAMLFSSCSTKEPISSEPNIIYILADDLGYGDISSFNPASKIISPNIDMIATGGMMFKDAHSGSSTGTGSRYGILTGRYSWRTEDLEEGDTGSRDKPLIDGDRLSVASMLKEKGYSTACIGEWQLGLGWVMDREKGATDFSRELTAGPGSYGFDYSYIVPNSLNVPPYVYIENHKVTSQPDRITSDTSKYGGWKEGLTGADFQHEEVLPHLTDKAVEWINGNANKEEPFFLYFAPTAPHAPILPSEEFRGVSSTNPYGDFVVMLDHMVGRITDALKENNASENTIVIFTSDNGYAPGPGIEQLSTLGHSPGFVYRGHKSDIFEGGHRVPFIISWPDVIKPGRTGVSPVSLNDLIATMADITGYNLPDDAAEDSYSMLPLIKQENNKYERESIIHYSVNGDIAIRKGKWKLIASAGTEVPGLHTEGETEETKLSEPRLYNLDSDPREEDNIAEDNPAMVDELKELLLEHIRKGRSTPGTKQ